MRFDELILRRYGHFTDFRLSFPKPDNNVTSSAECDNNRLDFHILYGPNEAGKSTTLSAITDLLYGFERITPWKFLHSNELLEIEATLHQNEVSASVKRFKNRLTNTNGDRLDSLPFDLQGLSRDDYRSRFSFDEGTLQKGGDNILNSQGDVGEALFSASSGISNLSSRLNEVMKSADSFWTPGRKSKIDLVELKKQLSENKAQLNDIRLDSKLLQSKLDSLSQAQEQADKAAEKRNDISLSLKRLEKEKSLFSLATRWMAEKASLLNIESMGVLNEDSLGVFDLSSETSTQTALKQLRIDIQNSALATAKKNGLQSDIEKTREQLVLSALSRADSGLLSSRVDIELFIENASAATEWQSQVNEHLDVIEQYDSQVKTLSAELKISPQDADGLTPGDLSLDVLDKLLNEEKTLTVQLDSASKEIANIENLDSEEPSQNSAITTIESLEIIKDFLQRINNEQLSNHLSIAREAEVKKRQELDSSAIEFGLSVSDLNAMRLPDEQWLLDILESWKLTKDQINQIDEKIQTSNVDFSDIKRQIGELKSTDLSDPDLLFHTSKSRDQLWQTHREAIANGAVHEILDNSAQQFEKEMLNVDRATSLALDQKDQHAKLRLLRTQELQVQKDLEALALSKTSLDSKLRDYEKELNKSIQSFYTLPSIHQESIRTRFSSAIALRNLECSAAEQSGVVKTIHEQCIAQAKKLLNLLAPLLDSTAPAQLETLELNDLTQYAEKFVKREQEKITEHEHFLKIKRKSEDELKHRKTQLASLEIDYTEWQKKWQAESSSTFFQSLDADRARDAVNTSRQLRSALNASSTATILARQLENKISDRNSQLADALKNHDKGSLQELASSLTLAIDNVRINKQISDKLMELTSSLEELEAKHVENSQMLDMLCKSANCTSYDDLLALLEQTAKHRAAKEVLSKSWQQINEISGSENNEEDITRWSTEFDTENVEAQLLQLNQARAEAESEYEELHSQRVLAEHSVNEVGHDGDYARLVQERTNLLLDIEQGAKSTAIARAGRLVLNAAIQKFRRNNQSSILSDAQTAFNTLTLGRYPQLLPVGDDSGTERLFVIDKNEQSRSVQELSTGTRYQLYLSLRAAAHAEYASKRSPLPFVADDIMESFDDERSAAAFQVLGNMAKDGQVLYLTHHQHLIDIAQSVLGKDNITVHRYAPA